jgi:hypothetical protein
MMALIKDGDWTLFSSDIKRGRHTWVRHNPDGSQTFRTDYVVDPTIEANTAMRNMASPGWKGDYHKIASVPLNIYWDKLHQSVEQEDDRYLSKWLNDSDNRAWRSKDGRV